MRQKADGNKIFSMEKQIGSYRYQDNLGEQNVQPTQSVSLAVIYIIDSRGLFSAKSRRA